MKRLRYWFIAGLLCTSSLLFAVLLIPPVVGK